MATSTSRTVPSSPNPSGQDSPRKRDWSTLKTGDPGSAFRGISRGRGSRGGGVRGGRGGGHPPTNSSKKAGSQLDSTGNTPSPPPKPPVARKSPAPITTTVAPYGASEKAVNGPVERGKPGSRKQPRAVPAVTVAPVSPSQISQTAPPTPPRSSRRRRPQGKSTTTTTKPSLPSAVKTQKPRGGSTPASQTIIRKDVPPHLAAAHQAEIRHDIDALVERVRAVAMAENRPTTPGSHIDWAGDEDDSLPDLDDWGVTTTHTNATIVTYNEDQSEEISPILADALKPLPEPVSEVHHEGEREMETYDTHSDQADESPAQLAFRPSPLLGGIVSSRADKAPERCIIRSTGVEEPSSPTLPDAKPLLHPSLPPKPVAAMESLRARGDSVSKPSSLPLKPPAFVTEEAFTTNTEGLAESLHAPSAEERLERVSSASSSERGLTASIHASVPGLPESQSAPSLLSTSTGPRTHSRSQTEGRSGSQHSNASHRRGRSGASSPLGRHAYSHARNHSTPAGGAGSRLQHASRPVITGEAMSRLARTIGGLGPASTHTQTIPVTKDTTISSNLRLTS